MSDVLQFPLNKQSDPFAKAMKFPSEATDLISSPLKPLQS